MRCLLKLLAVLFLGCFTASALTAHTQAKLILSLQTARAGDSVLAGIHLQMEPAWHTYWKNSGASGIPTTLAWTLPAGIKAGPVQWPVPEKLPPDDFTTYVYQNEVVLLVPLQISPEAKAGVAGIKVHVEWLECKEACVPGSADLLASLNLGAEQAASPDAPLFAAWQKRLPESSSKLVAHAAWEKPAGGDLRPLVIEWSGAGIGEPYFYPLGSDALEVQGETERLLSSGGLFRLRKQVKRFSGDWPAKISGLLVLKTPTGIVAYETDLSSAPLAPVANPSATPESAVSLTQPLWKMLLYAFLGGLILNAMPCVLPVIALKILGFVREARSDPRHVRKLGWVYALGVLVSFLSLAGVVIAVQAAGHKAGWGMQFSNAQFTVGLTVLVTLVALNLFGLFEVNPGSRVLGAAGNLAAESGLAGAFFNGVLATILATPCTAPFLGAALGFAFAQPVPIILLMFAAVAAGLAAPYVVLSWKPAWLRFLPKPGAWMEHFKIAMGFPMLATALWLLNLTTIHYGDRSWWLGIFLVMMSAAAWIWGAFVQRGSAGRGLAVVIVILCMAGGYFGILEAQLHWRSSPDSASDTRVLAHAPEGYAWSPWSPEAVAKARAEGRPVVVDFTAKWCLTCNLSVAPAFASKSVVEQLQKLNAVALVADYTLYPAQITAELARFQRSGVPLVLIYPRDAAKPPEVLPEPLPYPASYIPVLLGALERAVR